MHSIVKAAIDLRNFKYNLDDDLVDRLNRQYTSAVLILFAVLVSARQHFGEVMHCWCPEVRQSNHNCMIKHLLSLLFLCLPTLDQLLLMAVFRTPKQQARC